MEMFSVYLFQFIITVENTYLDNFSNRKNSIINNGTGTNNKNIVSNGRKLYASAQYGKTDWSAK